MSDYTLSDDDLDTVRDWVGDKESEDAIRGRYTRKKGDLDATILSTMRHQLSVLLSNPASINIPDAIALSTGDNIAGMRALIAEFRKTGAGDSGSGVRFSKMVRRTPR